MKIQTDMRRMPGKQFLRTDEYSSRPAPHGFTLIELLVVISIMALVAALIFPVVGVVKRREYLNTASAELEQIKTALQNYQAKYGVYPPSNPNLDPAFNTLYYELSGVTNNGGNFVTLDGACAIKVADYSTAFTSIGGVINCTSGGAEDGKIAQDFLPSLKQNRYGTSQINNIWITNLVTSVRGPDTTYKPVGVQDVNPFRYSYPGTNNPGSFDLWIDLRINGKTNRICNWKSAPFTL